MPRLVISSNADRQIRGLPRDKTLLIAIWRQLEWFAEDPALRLEKASFPHRPDRLRASFKVFDTAGKEWGCDALFICSVDVMTITSFAAARSGDYFAEVS
jgi:hypothetical protein